MADVVLKKVTRYNGKTGYDVLVDGERVGEVHRSERANTWSYSASKRGVYASGNFSRTRESAVRALVAACGGGWF